VAPSLIPVKPGERIKTDRRDARKLAKLLAADMLTQVRPPSLEEESLRDLTRAREDLVGDLLSARHRLSKMLLRHGFVYRDGNHWTNRHGYWLRSIKFEDDNAQQVFNTYRLGIEQIEERLKQLTDRLEEISKQKPYAQPVAWLRCLRGVDTITAMTIVAELHDFRRFTEARHLMSYLGLTPSEHSSSTRTKRGSITKAGNGHVRRVLVEAAWNYRHKPAVSALLRKRRAGQPEAVLAIADRAQQRLHKKYYRMKEGYMKPHNVVTVAVARELVGFIWAILHHEQVAQ
jgi:transposase